MLFVRVLFVRVFLCVRAQYYRTNNSISEWHSDNLPRKQLVFLDCNDCLFDAITCLFIPFRLAFYANVALCLFKQIYTPSWKLTS